MHVAQNMPHTNVEVEVCGVSLAAIEKWKTSVL